jgi:hypothetical protein
MLTVLVAIRDWLVALALAWVGVSMERAADRDVQSSATCVADASAPCND